MNQPHSHVTRGGRRGFTVVEMLMVLALFGVLAAIALPMAQPAVAGYQLAGQAHAIAYDIGLAKMQAASGFTQARLFVNLATNSYRVEVWDKASSAWVNRGDTGALSSGIGFGYGAFSEPPPDTQGVIGQAPPCLDNALKPIASTSCVVFNSRGVPVDGTGVPTAADAVYVTDGSAVYGVTVAVGGLTQLWWTPTRALAWKRQ